MYLYRYQCSCSCYVEGRSCLLDVDIFTLVKYVIDFGLHNKLIVDFHQRNFLNLSVNAHNGSKKLIPTKLTNYGPTKYLNTLQINLFLVYISLNKKCNVFPLRHALTNELLCSADITLL